MGRSTPVVLSDAQAKGILADPKRWPGRTKKWFVPAYSGYWLKACPSAATRPYIHPPEATRLTTRPDGMYVYVHAVSSFADVIVIEVCHDNQNFNDKRSRYSPGAGNTQITLPSAWLDSAIDVQGGHPKKVWDASGWFTHKPTGHVVLTVRHLRALFVLTDSDYQAFGTNHLPAGHEYFCRHRDLGQINHQEMQAFIKDMALMKHFRVRP